MYSIARRSAIKTIVAPFSKGPASSGYATSSTMHDNDPEVLEREKHRNLSGKQHETSTPIHDAPGWNEHLASTSEAGVKADRSDHRDPIAMQKNTVDYVQARHHPEDRLSRREATSYDRDEISGPLSSAGATGGVGPEDSTVKIVKETKQKTEVVKEEIV